MFADGSRTLLAQTQDTVGARQPESVGSCLPLTILLREISKFAKLSRVPCRQPRLFSSATTMAAPRSWTGSPTFRGGRWSSAVGLLAEQGHGLRRPAADYLRDGIYELRAKAGRVQYRMLYFFDGRQAVVISHGIIKREAAVPPIEI